MPDRVLAEVEVFAPRSCYVAPNADDEWHVTEVSRSALGGADGEVVEEFTLAGEDAGTPPAESNDAVEAVFAYDHERVYRFARPADQGCVCERIESAGCVVQSVDADEDSMVVTFLVEDIATLRAVVEDLRDEGDSINLRRLVESAESDGGGRPAVLDRDTLTDRQNEVLERAYEMGYFEHPRDATAGEVADALGIATTTFTEHLAAAQRKLLDDLLGA
ncbi:helix-turn-helix domain-containing protein [Halomicroarcula sp. F13]|uniref:Helix-turn-helix domain-containing protein n=1 Tax=Haloarcula rubra TaxID=2487747 RepID=A0AAW4PKA5_9EURY|nr:helix-turn-helix domain-containing protein [Halomicroarcula rubra]MBX0321453.1 helix-turn-helix domain-containing protein [Halomicroarcula rubra]